MEIEEELARERDNADRVAAALSVVLRMMRNDDLECLRATVIGAGIFSRDDPQLTVGHVIDGALALHAAERTQL